MAGACSAPLQLEPDQIPAKTGKLVNMNPDPNGEPWLAGGMPIPDEKSRAVIEASTEYFPQVYHATLPSRVDNSTLKFFRPIFSQNHGSCAQASGVGYTYTYEINRLRNLDASLEANQYPTHFTYNFLNGGNGEWGSWYWDGWKIIGEMGVPNVVEYGGMGSDATTWKSGYQLYKNALGNPLTGYSRIDVSRPTGLNNFKQWLAHHGEGSATGGVAVFAAGVVSQYSSSENGRIIPAGLPEAGKWIITKWGTTMNHAMTIVGYDDTVKIDYNGDGLYTNDRDIDGDGLLTLKDYEVGAMIVVNSWGTSWGDNGRGYMMYRLLGEFQQYTGNGGVYNNEVWIIHTKETTYTPKATLKVAYNYSMRGQLSLTAGISADLNATAPEFTLRYSALNFAGGGYPVKGMNTTGDIELALDITYLVNKLPANASTYKVWLTFSESDYANTTSGSLTSLQLIDHTNNNQTYTAAGANTAFANNTTTSFTIKKNNQMSSVYPSMFLRGTMNGWATTAMTLVNSNTWQVNLNLPANTAYTYKYDAYGNWAGATNWGTSATAGIAAAGGGNIAFTTGTAGTYTFQFNDLTRAYSVTTAALPVAATPTFNVAAGAVTPGTFVNITSATAGSTIYFTTDGSTPTTSSLSGTAGQASATVPINSALTLKAIAVANGMTTSAVASAAYTLLTAATPTFSKAAGSVTAGTVVTLSSTTAGSTIYYTLDGSTPTTSSPSGAFGTASASITVNTAVTIKAIAWKTAYQASPVATAAYTIASTSTGTLTITFIAGGNSENITFPGDANGWSLAANTLAAAGGSTNTLTLANAVTSAKLATGNSTSLLELKVCNTSAGWNGAWGFASWTKGAGVSLTDGAGQQIGIACQPGQNVNLTINAATSTLSVTVQ